MPLGNMLSGSEQQYVARNDDAGTWRILNTWHEDLKRLEADDEVPEDSPAVTILSEGQFIALMKEAASLGVLANMSFGNGETDTNEMQYLLDAQEEEITELKDSVSNLRGEAAQRKIELSSKSPHSEEYDLKERAMDSILKLVSMQDMTNLSRD